MMRHNDIGRQELTQKIKTDQFGMMGVSKLKIFGLIHYNSGKRMKKVDRIFFKQKRKPSPWASVLMGLHAWPISMENN